MFTNRGESRYSPSKPLLSERSDDALWSFEESATIGPARGSAINRLAEVWLRQNQQPFEALRDLDRAIELKQASCKASFGDLSALSKLSRTFDCTTLKRDREARIEKVFSVPKP